MGRDQITDGSQCICFQPVKDYPAPVWPGQDVPQQMHLDVMVEDFDAAEPAVLELGATKHEHQPGTSFRVYPRPGRAPVLPLHRLERGQQFRDHVGDGVAGEREVLPRVGERRVGVERCADLAGEGDVERRADVDLADARGGGLLQLRDGTPDEPCSTSGTGTAAAMRVISSRSKVAVCDVIAWVLPTATASASTPVAATNAAASPGQYVRRERARRPCRRSRRARPRPRVRARAASGSALGSARRSPRRSRCVVHHRGLRARRREVEQHGSVTWSRCTDAVAGCAAASDGTHRAGRAAGVVADRVLADLEHDRPAGALGAEEDALGVLEGDHVEGHDAPGPQRQVTGPAAVMRAPPLARRPPGRSAPGGARIESPAYGASTAAPDNATASCRTSATASRPDPAANAASAASPAPVGLQCRRAGTEPCHMSPPTASTIPSAPTVTATATPESSDSRRAASRGSATR